MVFFRQIWIAVIVAFGGLKERVWMSLSTVVAVALVISVLLGFQAMTYGFQKTLESTGSDNIAFITRANSTSEINSVIDRESFTLVEQAGGIAKTADGTPFVSGELYVVVDGVKKSSGTQVNLPLRGLSETGMKLRERAKIVQGRMFEPGKNELIVGAGVLKDFSGFELGSIMRFGRTQWQVVGVFSVEGTVFDGELWADARIVQSQFNRGSSFQSVRAVLTTPGDVSEIQSYIDADPRLVLDVTTEKDYYAEQGRTLASLVTVGEVLAAVMSVGALAGALNTMMQSVASRAADIATLRAIGFNGFSAFFATLLEAVLLATIGGLIGVAGSFLLLDGVSASTLGSSFSQVVFTLSFTPEMVATSIRFAVIIGLVGGTLPAIKAARVPLIVAFRS